MRLCPYGRQWLKSITCHQRMDPVCRVMTCQPWPRWFSQLQTVNAVGRSVEAFSFLGLAGGFAKVLWSARALPPSKLGRIGIPRPAMWTCCSSNSTRVASGSLTSSRPSGLGFWSGVLRSQGAHPGPRSSGAGGIGSWVIRHGLTRGNGRWQQEWMLKGTATCEHRDPWWAGWRVTRPSTFPALVRYADAVPGTSVVTASELCAQSARWRQIVKASLQCVVLRCKSAKPFATRCHHWAPVNPRWTSSEPSWACHQGPPEGLPLRQWQFLLMGLGGVFGLGVTQTHHPIRCMDSTSSSSRGLAPDSAIEAIEESRVREWRHRHSMQDDNDFAFAFLDYDQALTQAGRAIAHAWLESRHAALGSMLQQVESTIREVDAKTPSTCRTLQIRPKQRKRPLRLKENQADAPEAVQRRVNALCQVWTEAGALDTSVQRSWHNGNALVSGWPRSMLRRRRQWQFPMP